MTDINGITTDLRDYGYRGEPAPDTARVIAVHRERYALITAHGPTYGFLGATSYFMGEEAYPTVGDFVRIDPNPDGDSRIVATLPRRSLFARRKAGQVDQQQAVAANVDYLLLTTSLNNDYNPRRLERYLTVAFDSGATPVIVLTKADLCADPEAQAELTRAMCPGVAVHTVSAHTGQGMDELSRYIAPRITIALLGSSGVGKSSLLNALAGEELMRVNATRDVDSSKGRHTTTHRQLVMLPGGAMVIDTPGMRELGVWCLGEGLSGTFADVEAIIARGCRFRDCRHETEPGCAVRAALDSGELDPDRWRSYQTIQREARFTDDRAAAMREKAQRNKAISKLAKSLKKR